MFFGIFCFVCFSLGVLVSDSCPSYPTEFVVVGICHFALYLLVYLVLIAFLMGHTLAKVLGLESCRAHFVLLACWLLAAFWVGLIRFFACIAFSRHLSSVSTSCVESVVPVITNTWLEMVLGCDFCVLHARRFVIG